MNQDLRYIQTENKIRNAFFELLKTTPFDQINIKMLVNQANMNRTTFYLHYEDKYDLLETIEKEIFNDLKSRILKECIKNNILDFSFQNFIIISNYLNEHKDIFMLLAGKNGDPFFLEKHFNRVGDFIKNIFSYRGMFETNAYMIEGLKGMFMAYLKTWIQRDFKETPEELVENVKASMIECGKLFNYAKNNM